MSKASDLGRIQHTYIDTDEARSRPGLRLVLGRVAIPGPWREACRAIFDIKRLAYTRVAATGADGTDASLVAWTAQASAPVAIWNNERPRSGWLDQLLLAERLAPDPPLMPPTVEERIVMVGLSNELMGEQGLGWQKRLLMVHHALDRGGSPSSQARWREFGAKYGYSPGAVVSVDNRIVEILSAVDARIARQQALGSHYAVGDTLSALDIYIATAIGIVRPLPEALCPMAPNFRVMYERNSVSIDAAITSRILAHRDFIYENFLELPIRF